MILQLLRSSKDVDEDDVEHTKRLQKKLSLIFFHMKERCREHRKVTVLAALFMLLLMVIKFRHTHSNHVFPQAVHIAVSANVSMLPLHVKNVDSWRQLNPQYAIQLYDERQRRNMIVEHAQDLVKVYDALVDSEDQVNFWKYAVVYFSGGVATQVDVECVLPIEDWNRDFKAVFKKYADIPTIGKFSPPKVILGIDGAVMTEQDRVERGLFYHTQFTQHTFASIPGHDLFKMVLENIKKYINLEKKGVPPSENSRILSAKRTGVEIFTKTVNQWFVSRGIVPKDVGRGFPILSEVGVLEETAFALKDTEAKSDLAYTLQHMHNK
jgi:hypothetical protein